MWVILNSTIGPTSQDSFHHTINILKDSMAIHVCSKCLIICNYPFMLEQSGYEKFPPLLGEGGMCCKKERIPPNLGMFVGKSWMGTYKSMGSGNVQEVSWGLGTGKCVQDSKCLRTWSMVRKEKWLRTLIAIPRGGWTLIYCWSFWGVGGCLFFKWNKVMWGKKCLIRFIRVQGPDELEGGETDRSNTGYYKSPWRDKDLK